MYTRLSNELKSSSNITLPALFVTEYLPYAASGAVKVYLYGLHLAQNEPEQNTLEVIATKCEISALEVTEVYKYWEEQGLVNIVATVPPTIEYLPVKSVRDSYKKLSKGKYKSFNDQLHALLPSRPIMPNEYNEYYNFMETNHFEPEAMLCVISYCKRIKDESISYSYILAVARNLAHEGYTTYDRVTEKLSELELYNKDLTAVLHSLKLRRAPEHEDKRLLVKWRNQLAMPLEVIIYVAKTVKKGGMEKLNSLLAKYYENRLFTIEEIKSYSEDRDKLFELAKNINRIIGVYYEQLDNVVESYVLRWQNQGFVADALTAIAEYCFRHNIRTLDGMNDMVTKFYKQGLLTVDTIGKYIGEIIESDKVIKNILDLTGATRSITTRDRDSYRTWQSVWKMPGEVIEYCATLSFGKANPIGYMNSIMADWYSKNLLTLPEVKSTNHTALPQGKPPVAKTYTADQLNALFDSLTPEDM